MWRWLEVQTRGGEPCPIAAVAHMACSKLPLSLPSPSLPPTPPPRFSHPSHPFLPNEPVPVCSSPHTVSLFSSSVTFPFPCFLHLLTLPLFSPPPDSITHFRSLPCLPPSCLSSLALCSFSSSPLFLFLAQSLFDFWTCFSSFCRSVAPCRLYYYTTPCCVFSYHYS